MAEIKCSGKGNDKVCYETREYQSRELRCEVKSNAWWSEREDICVLPESQTVNGVELPWASTVYIKENEMGEKWISYARVQSLFMMGGTVQLKGESIPHVLGVSFDKNGEVSSMSLFYDGCTLLPMEQQYPWKDCCILHKGCSIMFTNDGSFDRCEPFELPDSE